MGLGVFLVAGCHALWARPGGLLFQDDAFYYLGVARNLARGLGPSFDGLHPTNGFHPGWVLLLTPIYWLVSDPVLALRLVVLLEAGLLAAAAVVLCRGLLPRVGPGPALLPGLWLVAAPSATSSLRAGMESALFVFVGVLVWTVLLRCRSAAPAEPGSASEGELPPRDTFTWLSLGVLAAALFLVRLEALLLLPVLILLRLRALRERPVRLLLLSLPPLLALGLYLAWSWTRFGLLGPVSGLVKAHEAAQLAWSARFARLLELPWLLRRILCRLFGNRGVRWLPPLGLALWGAGTTATLVLAWVRRQALGAALRRAGATPLLLLAAAMFLANGLSQGGRVWAWLATPLILAEALLLAGIVAGLPMRWRRASLALVLLLTVLRFGYSQHRAAVDPDEAYIGFRVRAARWIAANLPPDARVGSFNAGALGYFAKRPVVNLDGLVNSPEYYREVILGGGLTGYLEREGIGWIADEACGHEPDAGLYLLRGAYPRPEERFVRVAHVYRRGPPWGCPGVAVWRRRAGP